MADKTYGAFLVLAPHVLVVLVPATDLRSLVRVDAFVIQHDTLGLGDSAAHVPAADLRADISVGAREVSELAPELGVLSSQVPAVNF